MKYIIDTDPGIDDAIAIMLGVLNNLDIIGFTLATGNISINNAENNLKVIQEVLKSNIKMYKGLIKNDCNTQTAEYAHGKDGLGNIFRTSKKFEFESKSAEDFIIESANMYNDNLTVICLGPLTNLASALDKDPSLAKKVKNVVIMGATYCENVDIPYKEFNVSIDPLAAKKVFDAPFENIKIITHEIGVKSFIEKEYIDSLRTSKNEVSNFVYQISQKYMAFSYEHYKTIGLGTPDPTTIASVLDKNLITFKPCTIFIKDSLSYINLTEKSNIYVSTDLNINLFREIFKKTFH